MALKKISYQVIITSSLFFRFTVNLDQSRGQMPDAPSTIFTFFIDNLKKRGSWHYEVYFVKLLGVYQALWPLLNSKKNLILNLAFLLTLKNIGLFKHVWTQSKRFQGFCYWTPQGVLKVSPWLPHPLSVGMFGHKDSKRFQGSCYWTQQGVLKVPPWLPHPLSVD